LRKFGKKKKKSGFKKCGKCVKIKKGSQKERCGEMHEVLG
jgi:hypothetical protein